VTSAFDRVEALLEQLQRTATAEQCDHVRQILAAVLEVHAVGVGRMVELAGPELALAFAADERVAPLLLLHDCHPHDAARRIGDALADQHDRLARAGVSVRSVMVEHARAIVDVVTQPSARGREMLVELILAAAPDIDDVVLTPAANLIPVARLTRSSPTTEPT
jgi:hypothetical protein